MKLHKALMPGQKESPKNPSNPRLNGGIGV